MERSIVFYLGKFATGCIATFVVVSLMVAGLQLYVPGFYETLGPASLMGGLAALVIVSALAPARAFAANERRQPGLGEGFVLSHLFSAVFLAVMIVIALITDWITHGTLLRDVRSDPPALALVILGSFVVFSLIFWLLFWAGITGELRRAGGG